MKRSILRVLAGLVLLASVAGLAVTVPHLLEAEPGFFAKMVFPVLGWIILGVGSAVVLYRSFRRP